MFDLELVRNFDARKIFQNSFFEGLDLPADVDDETVLKTFEASDKDSARAIEKKFAALRRLDSRLKEYRRRIIFYRKFLRDEYDASESSDDEREAMAKLIGRLNWAEEAAELLNLKFGSLYVNGDKILNQQYRREFAKRLKAARLEAGLPQIDLAQTIAGTQNKYASYETARNEPSIGSLIRICRRLNTTPNDLLGFD